MYVEDCLWQNTQICINRNGSQPIQVTATRLSRHPPVAWRAKNCKSVDRELHVRLRLEPLCTHSLQSNPNSLTKPENVHSFLSEPHTEFASFFPPHHLLQSYHCGGTDKALAAGCCDSLPVPCTVQLLPSCHLTTPVCPTLQSRQLGGSAMFTPQGASTSVPLLEILRRCPVCRAPPA